METVSKRQMLKRRAAAMRRMNAPDVLRMVALCPKCPSWFPSVEARNEHRRLEHGPRVLLVSTSRPPAAMTAEFRKDALDTCEASIRAHVAAHGGVLIESTVKRRFADEPFVPLDGDVPLWADEVTAEAVGIPEES